MQVAPITDAARRRTSSSAGAELRSKTAADHDVSGSDRHLLTQARAAEGKARAKALTGPAAAATDATSGAAAITERPYDTWISDHGHGTTPAVIAHRGNATKSGTEGNDLASLRAAAADGASDAVEFDIQPLADGSLVVYHDGALTDGPLQGRKLKDLTLDDLADYPEIPTLEQFASEAGRLDVNLMAEFKGSGYERSAIEILQRHVDIDQLAVWSFSHAALRGVHEVDGRIPVGLVAARGSRPDSLQQQFDDLGFRPDFVELNASNTTREALATAERTGTDLMFGSGQRDFVAGLAHRDDVIGFVANDPVAAEQNVDRSF